MFGVLVVVDGLALWELGLVVFGVVVGFVLVTLLGWFRFPSLGLSVLGDSVFRLGWVGRL